MQVVLEKWRFYFVISYFKGLQYTLQLRRYYEYIKRYFHQIEEIKPLVDFKSLDINNEGSKLFLKGLVTFREHRSPLITPVD